MAELISEIAHKHILHWNCRGFKQLPDELKLGQEVKEIYVKWNNLLNLPIWIAELKNLTNLYLQHNQLRSLPEELSELKHLRVLDVTNNQIQVLPKRFGRLVHLTHFLAGNNRLYSIPDDFQTLLSLKVLDLSSNSFTHFSEPILTCHSLEELFLDNNFITALPDNIVYFPHLETLSVSGNNLQYLPLLPFLTNPSLNFENNGNLNFLSIWLGQQISSRNLRKADNNAWCLPSIQGCFMKIQPSMGTHYRHIIVRDETSEREQYISLPPSLKYITSGQSGQNVAPLLELTLRKVYCLNYHHIIVKDQKSDKPAFVVERTKTENENYLSLPKNLQHQLNTGPVTLCYHCQGPIFQAGVIWVIQKNCCSESYLGLHFFHVLSVILFCSVACSMAYARWEQQGLSQDKLEVQKLQWTHSKSKRRL